MAQLLDQLHVDGRAELEPQEDDNAQEVPVELAAPALEPQLAERPEEQESVVINGECSIPSLEPTDSPRPSCGSQEAVQPPDITSTVGQNQCHGADAIVGGVPFADRQADLESSGPLKPPRQFTVEPDIVASTKKPPPSRPPPPSGGPPPRPPPPSKKSQECLRLSGLEGRENSTMTVDHKGVHEFKLKCVLNV